MACNMFIDYAKKFVYQLCEEIRLSARLWNMYINYGHDVKETNIICMDLLNHCQYIQEQQQ